MLLLSRPGEEALIDTVDSGADVHLGAAAVDAKVDYQSLPQDFRERLIHLLESYSQRHRLAPEPAGGFAEWAQQIWSSFEITEQQRFLSSETRAAVELAIKIDEKASYARHELTIRRSEDALHKS